MDSLIVFGASYLYFVVVAVAVIVFLVATPAARVKLLKLAVVVLPLSFIVATGLGHIIASPRPFMVEPVQPLIPSATDNGFPSDHMLLAGTLAALVYTYNRKIGAGLLICAVAVGAARVLAHVHHPIDVIGSLVIAASITLAVHFLSGVSR